MGGFGAWSGDGEVIRTITKVINTMDSITKMTNPINSTTPVILILGEKLSIGGAFPYTRE